MLTYDKTLMNSNLGKRQLGSSEPYGYVRDQKMVVVQLLLRVFRKLCCCCFTLVSEMS